MDVRHRIETLVGDLTAQGLLSSDEWREALHAVPRHLFAPDRGWATPDYPGGGPPRSIDRDADEPGWWDAVYSDTSITTQADDGATDPASGQGLPTSSLSAPGIVAAFLELLDVHDHDRVLDIGTGTGWTPGLLSARVGDARVTSIEVDPAVADQAAANLKRAGRAPHLITGDGAAGWPDGAPYDRVHVTAGVSQIPYAWVEQTRPGGVIVLPWTPGVDGLKARLTVLGDGTAIGSLHGPASYMMLRDQRTPQRWATHHASDAAESRTRIDPRPIATAGPGLELAITAHAPGTTVIPRDDDNGEFSLMMYELARTEGTWAACDYYPDRTEYDVLQYGDRHLWDEVSAAYMWWLANGRPGPERYGLTVTPDGVSLWLDHPGNLVCP
ncbi:MAG TPA: methyltransferase domain-containing protein [Streptosporangiaceae bacterium]|jgi:protein-L-isoaspartate(D-aspartate) O-methyltransferase